MCSSVRSAAMSALTSRPACAAVASCPAVQILVGNRLARVRGLRCLLSRLNSQLGLYSLGLLFLLRLLRQLL